MSREGFSNFLRLVYIQYWSFIIKTVGAGFHNKRNRSYCYKAIKLKQFLEYTKGFSSVYTGLRWFAQYLRDIRQQNNEKHKQEM